MRSIGGQERLFGLKNKKNKKIVLILYGWFLVLLLLPSLASSQGFKVVNVEVSQGRWGWRQLIVRVDNSWADSVRVETVLYTLYQDHHISGLDRAMYDSSYVIPPGYTGSLLLDFELPASYNKRLVTQVFIYWEFPDPITGQLLRDSTFQSFNNLFFPSDSAFEYANNKYLVGPIGCLDNNDLLAFDYPRIMLYLLGRGETVEEISKRFNVEPSYTEYLVDKAVQMGLLNQVSESNYFNHSYVSISEQEGYEIRSLAQTAAGIFIEWYRNEGEKELTKILKESGIEESVLKMPSVRMQVLLTAKQQWYGLSGFFVTPRKSEFSNVNLDTIFGSERYRIAWEIQDFRRSMLTFVGDGKLYLEYEPSWIVQGGEFFAPQLSLMTFTKNNQLYLGTFRYSPVQKYEKSPITDLMRIPDEKSDSILTLGEYSLIRASDKTAKANEFIKIHKRVAEMIEISYRACKAADIEDKKYLADYFYRFILGELFVEMQKEMSFDCVRVEYER